MSKSQVGGKGGTFCRFTVGSGERGASVKHLRYIAKPQAVRDEREGVWLKEFPDALLAAPYPVMVQHLCGWAHWQEQEEIIGHRYKGHGAVRTHYQAKMSFEAPISIAQAKSLLAEWMNDAFPKTQAAAFIHTNTGHLHIHVWIAARQTDGKKINLTARAFRQLDEKWNRLYCRATGRDEQEHLAKKWETERFKQLRREDKANSIERPERVGHRWNPSLFNERERQRLEGKETTPKQVEANYDRDQSRTRTDQSQTAREELSAQARKRNAAEPEPTAAAEAHRVQQALSEADKTVSEVKRLHQDASRVAEREREPEPKLESQRER